ncbi:DASS family sodium-coupled anion symporter [Celerinatantimonas diazotrophica]|uniref:DASS family divalent anion:Na+ symporter n=1 Tax=Celerinatantimonas diazotrophica TaxID=412034 RepID=A0A4V2PST8_9GAMM|nr:DASS family sodium-coupled anion symporter [Celerinatantimonas diazotrophica]TCK63971.1 DASS family divalent anion:Na+ symporter [Celerinatantimonas diazotrophica]CAG9297056.1 Inner membrane protein YbhI [Celerinatantimonas diazotrophica]
MKLLKLVPIILFPIIFWFTPHPAALTAQTWAIVGIYLAMLCGLVLRPYTDAVIMLIILGFASLFISPKVLFAGFGGPLVWFIISAFIICKAFVITGLGKRIAYLLLRRYGKNTLTLGYLMMFTDLILAPATGSNMSRSGGITYPIFRNIAEALNSTPTQGSRKLGAYLTMLMYVVSMGTSALFMTGMATNSITVSLANKILNINLEWMVWFKAAIVPAGLILLVAPLLIYKLYPPELKVIDNVREVAEKGLRELGPVKREEKLLIIFFVLGVLGWMTGSLTGIKYISVGLVFLSSLLLFKVLSWQDVVNEKGAWQTFVWYGAFYGIAVALAHGGFYLYLVDVIKNYVDLSHLNSYVAIAVLVLFSLAARYLFVSSSAFVVSFFPVLFTLGMTTSADPMLIALSLAFSAAYGALLTHYGNGAGVITFSSGYVPQKKFWGIGTVMVLINFLVYLFIGLPYWHFLGL